MRQHGRILYVDDEPINLSNFREALGGMHQILTAGSGEEALALLQREGEVAVVISDQRMPGMTGLELLIEVKKIFPETTRMIMSAYSEIADLLDAINQAQVYRYFIKPWEEEHLLHAVNNAVATYNLSVEIKKYLELKREELDGATNFHL